MARQVWVEFEKDVFLGVYKGHHHYTGYLPEDARLVSIERDWSEMTSGGVRMLLESEEFEEVPEYDQPPLYPIRLMAHYCDCYRLDPEATEE